MAQQCLKSRKKLNLQDLKEKKIIQNNRNRRLKNKNLKSLIKDKNKNQKNEINQIILRLQKTKESSNYKNTISLKAK